MIRKTRKALALGLVAVLGTSAVAVAGGGIEQNEENSSSVYGSITSSKMPKKQFVNRTLFAGVATEFSSPPPNEATTEEVRFDFDDDINFNFGIVRTPCSEGQLNGQTTQNARAACRSSIVGQGEAEAVLPSPGGPVLFNDLVVTAFDGPQNILYLHAYSPTLDARAGGTGSSANVIVGRIQNSPLGGDYGKRLFVGDAPDLLGDVGRLQEFNARLTRKGYVKARCFDRNRKLNYRAQFTYDGDSPADGEDAGDELSQDTAFSTSNCTVQR